MPQPGRVQAVETNPDATIVRIEAMVQAGDEVQSPSDSSQRAGYYIYRAAGHQPFKPDVLRILTQSPG
ncbi:MAG: hypothetical protein LC725_02650 [Lentisphaerae bacterium]|nr:hypothetical protein [Lentisphaerota bacterium]